MNDSTQICGLIIIAMLLFFYHRQPIMGLSTEHRFITTLYIILACVILDITSVHLIAKSGSINTNVVIFFCKLYLLSLEAVAFSVLRYTVSDLIDIKGSTISLYCYGRAATATYIIVGFYLLTVAVVTFVLNQHIKQEKTNALLFWMAIWIVAAIIEYTHPRILIVSFTICIGALILYFELENPQGSISRKTGHFSSAVIREYFDYLYQHNRTFSIMTISFRTMADASTENKLLRQTIDTLSDYLFNIDTAKVFDTVEGYFLLVFDNMDFMESTKFKISTYFQSIEDNPEKEYAVSLLNPIYTIVPDSRIASDADELMLLLSNFVPSAHEATAKKEIIIDNDAILEIRKKKHIEKLVIRAMEDDRIEVHYQPIYSIAENCFTGAEALVRIRLANGELVFPSDFIPIVEETGRIIPLSNSIYQKTFSFIKSYRIEKLGIQKVELNLSVKQGESPVFVSRFIELIEKQNVDPALISLEITETSSLSSKETLLLNMNKLLEHNIAFSLDDFGFGSSNLNYIIDMPVEVVKLDKHLTDEYFRNTKAVAIVKTVIEMAHSMGLRIIAEGIETASQFEEMKSLGVDYIQGYYFSKPLPEHEFLKFIQQNNLK